MSAKSTMLDAIQVLPQEYWGEVFLRIRGRSPAIADGEDEFDTWKRWLWGCVRKIRSEERRPNKRSKLIELRQLADKRIEQFTPNFDEIDELRERIIGAWRDMCVDDDAIQAFISAWNESDPTDHDIIELEFFEGCKSGEIAEILDKTTDVVYKRKSRIFNQARRNYLKAKQTK